LGIDVVRTKSIERLIMKKIMGVVLVWFCMAGLSWGETLGDVNADGKVGLPEATYALQVLSGMRPESVIDDVNVLLTHQANSGSFENLGDGSLEDSFKGTYRLTLNNVATSVAYSAEQPLPASGNTSMRAVIDELDWNPSNPPIAAVVITDPAVSDTQDVMLVRLMYPVYDESLKTLSFYVQQENTYQGKNLVSYIADADSSLPASFGQVNVMVDLHIHWPFSCGSGYIGCYLHYGCCSQPTVTQPLPRFKVSKCWMWSWMKCMPCSEDPCGAQYPDQCGKGNCYIDCLNDDACYPVAF
jgi:hypothetical protein